MIANYCTRFESSTSAPKTYSCVGEGRRRVSNMVEIVYRIRVEGLKAAPSHLRESSACFAVKLASQYVYRYNIFFLSLESYRFRSTPSQFSPFERPHTTNAGISATVQVRFTYAYLSHTTYSNFVDIGIIKFLTSLSLSITSLYQNM